jgi:ABC-type Zn uptake system ZnuABC Zn-binding protein ZnuA
MRRPRFLAALGASLGLALAPTLSAQPAAGLAVVATTTDLASLARRVGGAGVSVTSLGKGGEDPHFVEPLPSFVRVLHAADLYVQNGLELEVGWAPALLATARNPRIQRGGPGHLDVATVVQPLGVPTGPVDRSLGHVHPYGNPHYLLDPLNGLRAADAIAERLATLRPGDAAAFRQRAAELRREVHERLVGRALLEKYGDAEGLARLHEAGRLRTFLEEQGDAPGGWLGRMLPHAGARVVADHDLWPYFARRFGIQVVGFFEPKPGIAPTTAHLGALVQSMRGMGVKVVLASPYFDPRHARFVAESTGARTVAMAHQVGAVPGADTYVGMVELNVTRLAAAFAGAP